MIRTRLAGVLALALLACVVAEPAPAQPPRAGEVSLGVGLGLGTRTGVELSVKVMVSDDVGVTCKGATFVFFTSGTCGAHLHLFGDRQYYVVLETGVAGLMGSHPRPDTSRTGPRNVEHYVFVNTGLGADWRLNAIEELGLYAGIGPAFSLLSNEGDLDDEGRPRRRGFRPDFQPLFFFDLGFQVYPVSK